MKNFKYLQLTIFILMLALMGHSQAPLQSSNAKTAFVNDKNYLAHNAKDYKSNFGDSLKGFNEEKIKQDLLASGIEWWEASGHIYHLKRQYIKQKYNLVTPTATVTSGGSNSGGKKGNTNTINFAPCVNEGFELNAPGQYTGANSVTGWTISSRTADGNCSPTNWNPGSNKFYIVSTPVINFPTPALNAAAGFGIVGNSPLGGSVVAQLNDANTGDYDMTSIKQTFPVTSANTLLQFAYAGYWQDPGGGHGGCCGAPGVNMKMYDSNGNPLGCSSLSLAPGNGCQSSNVVYTVVPNSYVWTNWQVKFIDLSPYIGSAVTIELIQQDCNAGGHMGSMLFDMLCGGQLVSTGLGGPPGGPVPGPVSFCAGSNQAMISAPNGYSAYQWYGPGTGTSNPGPMIAAPQGTAPTLVVSNPNPGAVYTVTLTSPSGCQFVSTNTIGFSQVSIAGIGSNSTCPLGASGTATVQGNGSGTGYNYTWLNSSSVTVGTNSIVNNLAPGVYSVVISGFGAAGCGSAVATTTVGVSPPGIIQHFKPYCGSEAYLQTTGGTGHKWYAGNSLITGSLASLPNYTVTNPVNNAVYWVAYTSPQGCKDSVKFTLIQSAPGVMTVPPNSIKLICLGANNGTAAVSLSPASSAPPGFNSFLVTSTGGTMTPYTSSISPTSSNVYTVGGLSQGTYSVVGFDGSCKYSTTFNVSPLLWNFTVTPPASTLCPGNIISAAVSPTSSPFNSSYSYTWSPANWVSSTTLPNVFVSPPPISPGSVVSETISVKVTPSIAQCPITKTFVITNVNPPTPTITAIDPMCNTFAPYQVTVNPTGGTFQNAGTTPNLVASPSGIITPSLGAFSVNSFTYSINVHTCVARQSATFQVAKFHPSALTSTVPTLCVTNPAFNLMNIVQSTVGVWSGFGVTNATHFNPSTFAGQPSGPHVVTYSTVSTPYADVCNSITSTTIAVTNTLVPAITAVSPFCNNAGPITMTVSPSGGGWSGPNISAAGVITPTNIANPGSNSVTYTVTDGPCLNTASTTFNVVKFNTAKITGNMPAVCASGLPINLMNIVQSTVNGTWQGLGPVGVAVQSNSFIPMSQILTGTYTLQYNTTSSTGGVCDDFDQVVVSYMNPVTPTITSVGPFCSRDGVVQLTVTPATGQWVSSSYLNANGIFSPTLSAIGNNAVQYVVGSNSCNVSSTKFISVEAFVPAVITTPKLPDLCNTGSGMNLVPFTITNLGTWLGTGVSGTFFNPTAAGKGVFILTHTTASSPSGLCPDQATVAISVHSLAIPAITKVDRICNNAMPVQLNPTPVGGMFGGVNTNGVDKKGFFNPAAGIIGSNIINYSITAGPCVAYAQTTVVVEKFVSASFASYPTKFCKNDNAVNMNSYVLNPGGNWSGPGMVGNMFHPSKGKSDKPNIITYTIGSIPSGTLCPDVSTMQISVIVLPKISVVSNIETACAPAEVLFHTSSVNNGNAEWILGDGSESKKGLMVSHIYKTPGTYTVLFNYSNDGCAEQALITHAIKIHESPKANFNAPEEVMISDPQIQLTNLSTPLGNNKYSWTVDNTLSFNGEINPNFALDRIGKYRITLIAETEHGCKDEMTKTIEVKNNFNIYIPTSFTPNFDGLNDVFKPVFSEYGLDEKHYEMEIFDRWGHSLYRTKDPAKGWDGSIHNKGEVLKTDVFVYKIKYKDLDGNAYDKMGQVSLMDK